MAKLIDADKLREHWLTNGENEHIYDTNAFLDSIDDQPTVDAEEVVHGRFTNVQGLGDGTCVGFCSNCMTPHKANNLTALRIDYRHCRWCGAKMDGGNKDGKAD